MTLLMEKQTMVDVLANYGARRKPKLVAVHPAIILPCRVASSGCMPGLCMSERERTSEDRRKQKEREYRRAGCTSELN